MDTRPQVLGLLLLYVLALLPLATSLFTFYPDERHYVDGAIAMVQGDHDWVTPHAADGGVRLRKPVLPYWITAASFELFGVGVPAARLPFLLAGCLIVWATVRLARALTGDGRTAWLAGVVVASHVLLILASIRAMPDVLLALFVLVSAGGFLRALALGRPTRGALLAAYGGAGLAVATKGLLPLLFVAAAWFFALREGGLRALRRLLHGPSLVLGALLGGAWYAAMAWLHGSELLAQFGGDQLGNTDFVPAHALAMLVRYAASFVLIFLPWSVPAGIWLLRRRRARRVRGREPMDRARRLIGTWCLALLVVFAFAERWSSRYLLPVSPLVAIVLADLLARADPAFVRRSLRALLATAAAGLSLLAVVAGVTASEGPAPLRALAATAGFALVVRVLAEARRSLPWREQAAVLGAAVLVAFPLVRLWLAPVMVGDGIEGVARQLVRSEENSAPLYVVGGANDRSRVRLAAGGGDDVRPVARAADVPATAARALARGQEAAALARAGFALRPVASVPGHRRLGPALGALAEGRLAAWLRESREPCYLAERPDVPGAAAPPGPPPWPSALRLPSLAGLLDPGFPRE